MQLLKLFQQAEQYHKRAVIEVPFIHKTENDQHLHKLRFSLAAKRLQERFPNYLYITLWAGNNELAYLGKVTKDGILSFSDSATDQHKKLIQQIYENPVEALAQIGRDTGTCCYCGRPLTHPDSVKTGYGPICAEKYGLPWGS